LIVSETLASSAILDLVTLEVALVLHDLHERLFFKNPHSSAYRPNFLHHSIFFLHITIHIDGSEGHQLGPHCINGQPKGSSLSDSFLPSLRRGTVVGPTKYRMYNTGSVITW
jgi:hypothetical protein